MQKIIYLYT